MVERAIPHQAQTMLCVGPDGQGMASVAALARERGWRVAKARPISWYELRSRSDVADYGLVLVWVADTGPPLDMERELALLEHGPRGPQLIVAGSRPANLPPTNALVFLDPREPWFFEKLAQEMARCAQIQGLAPATLTEASEGSKLLLVEDDTHDAVLTAGYLGRIQDSHFTVTTVSTIAAAEAAIGEAEFDIVLTDLNLPDSSGRESVRRLIELMPDKPVVVLSGVADSELEDALVEMGAQDFICKADMCTATLRRCLAHAMIRNSSDQSLLAMAHRDPLTGVANRLAFKEHVEAKIAHTRIHGGEFAVMLIDLDGFKEINDTYGHAAGDSILIKCCENIRKQIGSHDLLARLGGDEFAIVVEQSSEAISVEQFAERIVRSSSLGVRGEGGELVATMSMGVARFPEAGFDVDSLLASADTAMYQAKRAGKACYRLWSPEKNAGGEQGLSAKLRVKVALQRGDISVCYQPQFDLSTYEICAAEAKLVWDHPERGPLTDAQVLLELENTDMVDEVGEWVLVKACSQLATWQVQGLCDLRLSLNVSPAVLLRQEFAPKLNEVIAEHHISPRCIELEIHEASSLVENPALLASLRRLSDVGVRLALDDFGAEQTALDLLHRLPLESLKLDRSLVTALGAGTSAELVTRAVVELGRKLGLEVIATGVESAQELRQMKAVNCAAAQGPYLAKPSKSWTCAGFKELVERASAEFLSSPLRIVG